MENEEVINTQDVIVHEEAPQEVVQPEEISQEVKPKEQPEGMPQKSFRMLREEKERVEKERDEMRRKLQEMESSRQQVQPQQEVEDDLGLNQDDYVEGKHLSKVSKKIKNLERQLEQYQQNSSLMTTETRLKSEYPDFDKVVSKDNLEVLRLTYPELAQTINSNPDLYVKAKSAYTLIKKFGIEQDTTPYDQENERASRNLAKPKPALNTQQGDSPLSMANAFAGGATKEARMKIYRQAQEYASKKGFM